MIFRETSRGLFQCRRGLRAFFGSESFVPNTHLHFDSNFELPYILGQVLVLL